MKTKINQVIITNKTDKLVFVVDTDNIKKIELFKKKIEEFFESKKRVLIVGGAEIIKFEKPKRFKKHL